MLKFDKLSESLAVLTNASVLVGLVFLIIEISQNNDFLEFEKESRSISELVESSSLLSRNDSLAAALFKDPSARTPEESWRLVTAVRSNFNAMQRAWQQGYFESTPGLTLRYRMGFHSNDPRGILLREVWESHKALVEDDYIEWFENNIANET